MAKEYTFCGLDGAEMRILVVVGKEFAFPVGFVFLEAPGNLDEMGRRGGCGCNGGFVMGEEEEVRG